MTDKLQTQIHLPVWFVVALLTMAIPFTIYTTSQIRAQQVVATKVEVLQSELEKKADKETVINIQNDIREIRKSTEDIKNLLLSK
jgi:sensor domain CHASE-containing protein